MPHGQRDHVLHRAAELAADHVGVGVRAGSTACGRRACTRLGAVGVGAGDHRRGRLLRGDLAGQVRARTRTATRSGAAPVDLARSPRSSAWWCRARCPSSARPASRPAAAAAPSRSGCPRSVCDGTASTTISAPVAAPRPGRRWRGRRRAAGRRAGSRGSRAARRSPSASSAPAGPQRHVPAGVGEHLGERGAPRAGAEDGGAGHAALSDASPGAGGRGWNAGGAGSPRSSASWSRTRTHDHVGHLAQQRRRSAAARPHRPAGGRGRPARPTR